MLLPTESKNCYLQEFAKFVARCNNRHLILNIILKEITLLDYNLAINPNSIQFSFSQLLGINQCDASSPSVMMGWDS